MKKREW